MCQLHPLIFNEEDYENREIAICSNCYGRTFIRANGRCVHDSVPAWEARVYPIVCAECGGKDRLSILLSTYNHAAGDKDVLTKLIKESKAEL